MIEKTLVEQNNQPAEATAAGASPADDSALEPLITLAAALLDLDRLRLVSLLAEGPANRLRMSEATGLSHRDLLRQLDSLQNFGLVRLKPPAPREPDHYALYELNTDAFTAARRAMGKYKGVRKRPSDSREMTLETFMPAGKLASLPSKHTQMLVVLEEIAGKFEPERQYPEREVNVILEDVNEDYCTLRRLLVDFGYMSRSGGIYIRNA
jgi:ArsR family transcriptional regulator, arsenate/arsenite/antimonite-responsive transcriptional repressor